MNPEGNNISELQSKLSELPPAFSRKSIEHLLPGIISSKTLSNLHSMGKGPKFFKMGRRVFYQREDFVSWLLASSRMVESKN